MMDNPLVSSLSQGFVSVLPAFELNFVQSTQIMSHLIQGRHRWSREICHWSNFFNAQS